LLFNVLDDHLIRNIAAATTKVAPSPKMSAPVRFSKVWKLVQQFERGLTLQPLHQTTDRHLRRKRDKQMDMVFRYMPFDDVNPFALAYFPDHIPETKGNAFHQNLLPVLRYPHQVQVDSEYRM